MSKMSFPWSFIGGLNRANTWVCFKGESSKVCGLCEDLKQPNIAWFRKFSGAIIRFGLHCFWSNHSVFSYTHCARENLIDCLC